MDGATDAWILGGSQRDFARKLTKQNRDPNSQTRDWTFPDPITDDDATNPISQGRLRRFDGSQMTDGGAGLVLRQNLDRAAEDPCVLPHVRATVLDALRRARVSLDDVDGFEAHECLTPSEYLAIDHIGLTGPGESWKAIENGEIEIGGGHPVGASGVRMLLDAATAAKVRFVVSKGV